MIVQKDFLNKIRAFGLNSYEAKLWTALLSRGSSTAGELSDISNVPRSRSYDVLESLEKKGFIVMKLGKPIKYIAVHPEEVVERVKKRIQQDADEHSKMFDEVKKSNVLDELKLLHKQGIELIEPTDISGSIRGSNNIYNQLGTMIRGAKESIVLATTATGLVNKHKALGVELKKASERGVKIRVVAPATKDNQNVIKALKAVSDVNESNKIKSRFCVVDEKEVLFMLMQDHEVHPDYDVGVWVSSPAFAATLYSMFNASLQK